MGLRKGLDGLSMMVMVVLLAYETGALLQATPCYEQGNPWISARKTTRQGSIVAMSGENVGHSPFNYFPEIQQYGNCITVYFSNRDDVINVTLVCGSLYAPHTANYQCPRYDPSVRWLLANLIYLQYDTHRFELSSCVEINDTHSYHGRMLLVDEVEPRVAPEDTSESPELLPMWRTKLAQDAMVPFTYNGECGQCSFRNEYIVHMRATIVPEFGQIGPEPYCVNGTHKLNVERQTVAPEGGIVPNRALLLGLLLILVPVVLLGGLMLCKRSANANTVAPAHATKP